MGNQITDGNHSRTRSVRQDDDVILYTQDWGRGKPIVLLHGWPLSADMWEYQARELVEQGYRVITFDRRGFGRSTKTFYGYHYDQLAADLNDVLTQLNLQQVILVGFSMAGGEIARYLSRYGSDRIEKTILISSVLPYLYRDEQNPEGVDPQFFERAIAQLKVDRPSFLRGFLRDFYGVGLLSSPVSEELIQWTHQIGLQASPKATIECMKSFSQSDFRLDLASFTMPTLVIHGSHDKIVPLAATSERTAGTIYGAKLKVYDGAPHGLFATHQAQLVEDIILFASSQKHLESPFEPRNPEALLQSYGQGAPVTGIASVV